MADKGGEHTSAITKAEVIDQLKAAGYRDVIGNELENKTIDELKEYLDDYAEKQFAQKDGEPVAKANVTEASQYAQQVLEHNAGEELGVDFNRLTPVAQMAVRDWLRENQRPDSPNATRASDDPIIKGIMEDARNGTNLHGFLVPDGPPTGASPGTPSAGETGTHPPPTGTGSSGGTDPGSATGGSDAGGGSAGGSGGGSGGGGGGTGGGDPAPGAPGDGGGGAGGSTSDGGGGGAGGASGSGSTAGSSSGGAGGAGGAGGTGEGSSGGGSSGGGAGSGGAGSSGGDPGGSAGEGAGSGGSAGAGTGGSGSGGGGSGGTDGSGQGDGKGGVYTSSQAYDEPIPSSDGVPIVGDVAPDFYRDGDGNWYDMNGTKVSPTVAQNLEQGLDDGSLHKTDDPPPDTTKSSDSGSGGGASIPANSDDGGPPVSFPPGLIPIVTTIQGPTHEPGFVDTNPDADPNFVSSIGDGPVVRTVPGVSDPSGLTEDVSHPTTLPPGGFQHDPGNIDPGPESEDGPPQTTGPEQDPFSKIPPAPKPSATGPAVGRDAGTSHGSGDQTDDGSGHPTTLTPTTPIRGPILHQAEPPAASHPIPHIDQPIPPHVIPEPTAPPPHVTIQSDAFGTGAGPTHEPATNPVDAPPTHVGVEPPPTIGAEHDVTVPPIHEPIGVPDHDPLVDPPAEHLVPDHDLIAPEHHPTD